MVCNHALPTYVEVTDLRPRELYEPANNAIEEAYRKKFPNNTVICGTQYKGGGDIKLPKGAENQKKNAIIMDQLRGISRQRQPDIVDFTHRVFYEIKTARYADEGVEQLKSLYDLAEVIGIQHGGEPWKQEYAYWRPPEHLPFPKDPTNKIICTADTRQSGVPSGLILYRVFNRVNFTTPSKASQGNTL